MDAYWWMIIIIITTALVIAAVITIAFKKVCMGKNQIVYICSTKFTDQYFNGLFKYYLFFCNYSLNILLMAAIAIVCVILIHFFQSILVFCFCAFYWFLKVFVFSKRAIVYEKTKEPIRIIIRPNFYMSILLPAYQSILFFIILFQALNEL